MFPTMGTNDNKSHESTTAPEIEALLSLSKASSVIDGLLTLPRAGEAASGNEWDRAVTSRLQSKLAQMLRDKLEDVGSRNAA